MSRSSHLPLTREAPDSMRSAKLPSVDVDPDHVPTKPDLRLAQESCNEVSPPAPQLSGLSLPGESRPRNTSEPESSELPKFGYFDTVRLLDRGGMGTVYLAEDNRSFGGAPLPALKVAIKVAGGRSQMTERDIERFLYEARVTANLRHPNIIPIHQLGRTESGAPYVVMPYIEGVSLAGYCALFPTKREPVPAFSYSKTVRRQFMDSFMQVLDAVGYAHSRGIVHRDLKPANLIRETCTGKTYVLDFGLAHSVSAPADANAATAEPAITEVISRDAFETREGSTVGTAAYMSPEQARGLEPDYRTDIFSLGIVLYEHLCGGHPFGALPGRNDVSVIVAIREERPVYPNEINQDVCPELAVVCWRALEKGLSNRFQSCQEFKEALQRALEAQKRYERGFFHKVWDTLRGR